MTSVFLLNKQSKNDKIKPLIHCRNNRVKLKKSLQCEKCTAQDLRLTKKFETVNALYSHLICRHNGNDKYEIPTKKECLEKLQKLSDSIMERNLE